MTDKTVRYGAKPEDWDHFCLLLGPDDLLPCVTNTTAKISPTSKMKSIGKTPSRYNRSRTVAGYPDWTEYKATTEDLDHWAKEPDYGISLQTKYVRALDIDVPDPELAKAIKRFITIDKGYRMPVRLRTNSGKCLFAFIVKEDIFKCTVPVKGGVIELLGNGQQFVAVGMHQSGVPYEWFSFPDNAGLPEEFPELTREQITELWREIIEKFGIGDPTGDLVVGTSRKEKTITDAARMQSDPIIHFLDKENQILSLGRDGQVNIDCPWKEGHSTDSGETQTTYFPAGTRGYQQGHFKCMHANCQKRTDHEFLEKLGYYINDFVDVSTPEDKEAEKVKRDRFKLYKPMDYKRRPRMPWLIKHILPRGETMMFGASGSGKTFTALDMCLRLALGLDWNGYKTTRSHTTYVCAEGQGGLMGRIEAWLDKNGYTLADINNWFGIMADTPSFLHEEQVLQVAEQINKHFNNQSDFICIDTLAQVTAGADENSAKEMGTAMRHAKLLGAKCRSGYGLVHHTGKDEEKGARGSSVIKGQLDAMFYISNNKGERNFFIEKMKDDKDGFGFDFRLDDVTVGVDEDGEPVSSCVVNYSGQKTDGKKKKRERKRGLWQQTVLTAWQNIGGGNAMVTEVVNEAMRMTPFDASKKRDRRRELAIAAIDALAQEGMFTVRDNLILVDLAADD